MSPTPTPSDPWLLPIESLPTFAADNLNVSWFTIQHQPDGAWIVAREYIDPQEWRVTGATAQERLAQLPVDVLADLCYRMTPRLWDQLIAETAGMT